MFEGDPLKVVRTIPSGDKAGSPAAAYSADGVETAQDNFVLYRIIGNDIAPRHRKGQSRDNLRFILDNEASLPHCEKRWVVNRIVDPREEEEILALLESFGQGYIRIAFSWDDYREIGWDPDVLPKGFLASREFLELTPIKRERAYSAFCRRKNNYIMNNNGARNAAIAEGRTRAKWVLPWDGNCFVTKCAWADIVSSIAGSADLKYFAVPMHRLVENGDCLADDFRPVPEHEPQLIFRSDAQEMFNTDFVWGRRPKVELFWRLGLTGPWDDWTDDPWDQKRREMSPEAALFGFAGWVVRLFSGMKDLEEGGSEGMARRGAARRTAIVAKIFETNRRYSGAPADSNNLAFYSSGALDAARQSLDDGESGLRAIALEIIAEAERALGAETYSVMDKSRIAPSGDPHDYCSAAPYWWPDPEKPDGLPYIHRDGLRAPGTVLFSTDSGLYDRTRLQLMLDCTTSLALAWHLTGRTDFAEHGARLVRTWFLDQSTRMNPHLKFAQVRFGHDDGLGTRQGIIDFKDIYYFLDGVRLIEHSGALTETDRVNFRGWLSEYLSWLETSEEGNGERAALNNHATYCELQMAAIHSYLEHGTALGHSLLRAVSRLPQHFTEDGVQSHEINRSISKHYVFFNLQGWLHLLGLLKNSGYYDIDMSNEPYRRLARALVGIVVSRGDWPYSQITPFDDDRFFPLIRFAEGLGLAGFASGVPATARPAPSVKARFSPLDGIAPYWQLALRQGRDL